MSCLALRDLYATYERNWNTLLAAAGDHPIDKLVALIDAEFDPKVCNNEFISVWFAFWGEKELVVAQGDELTDLDKRVEKVGLIILEELLGEPERAKDLSSWIETMLAGYNGAA